MHFFNPVPLLPLVEVIAGPMTDPAATAAIVALAERLGKTPVVAADTPGFIVNRVARPFYLEALRIVGDGMADVPAVDVAMRAAGFRMGPFELIDAIGADVNLAVSISVWEQFFGDPRYRPHPLQRTLVDAGRLGRKSGGGFYDYPADGPRCRGAACCAGPPTRRGCRSSTPPPSRRGSWPPSSTRRPPRSGTASPGRPRWTPPCASAPTIRTGRWNGASAWA